MALKQQPYKTQAARNAGLLTAQWRQAHSTLARKRQRYQIHTELPADTLSTHNLIA
jgi:hypothetical protein